MRLFNVMLMIMISTLVFINPGEAKNKKLDIQLGDESAVIVGGMRVTIGDAIRLAVENNKDILSQTYDVAMTDSEYKAFLGKYSIKLHGDVGYTYQKYPEAMQFMYGKDSKTLDGSVGFSKSLSTGTTFSAGMQHQYNKIKRDPIPGLGDVFGPNKSYTPVMYASLQQELLKNFLGYQDRRQKKILKNMGEVQKELKIYQLSYIVLGVIQDYWAVLVNKVNVEHADLQLYETTKVRNITARNVRLGLSDRFNLNYYNALVAGAQAELTGAKFKFKDSLRKLLTTLNQKPDLEVTGKVIFSNKMPKTSKEIALQAAYAKRADYRFAKMSLKNAKLQYEFYANDDLPSLTASVGVNTMGQQSNMSDAYKDSYTGKYPTIEARLKMSYPLGSTAKEVNLRNAKFRLQKARIELEKLKRQINDEVTASIEQIQTTYKLYKKAKEARIQSEYFYWNMLASMRRGRLTAATVKNGVDALIQGKSKELQALVNFNLAKLNYYVVKNELFEHYKINPYNYIPKDKK